MDRMKEEIEARINIDLVERAHQNEKKIERAHKKLKQNSIDQLNSTPLTILNQIHFFESLNAFSAILRSIKRTTTT